MTEEKPVRLQFDTYVQMLRNSIGTSMFRNWYVKTSERGKFDAMHDGEDSCAFFVSGVLKIMDKVKSAHGTVDSTIKDLEDSGWQEVNHLKTGDVLVWEAQKFGDRPQKHIGFFIGEGRAVSTSFREKKVIEHDLYFDEQNRKVEQILRLADW